MLVIGPNFWYRLLVKPADNALIIGEIQESNRPFNYWADDQSISNAMLFHSVCISNTSTLGMANQLSGIPTQKERPCCGLEKKKKKCQALHA